MTRSVVIGSLLVVLNIAFVTAQPMGTATPKAVGKAHNVWYVSGKGSDTNAGSSLAAAFRSLHKAVTVVQPGDTVLIGNGMYTNGDKGNASAVLSLEVSGRPDAWITWKALPGTSPELRPIGWNGINISGSYHVIDGLRITGASDTITLNKAMEQAKDPKPDPYYNTNGIFVEGRRRKPDAKPHHVIIRNCTVSKCPGGGITLIETDYVTVEDCKVFDNCWYMRYAGSGITTLNNWAFDDAPGYHIVIQRNRVWNNKTLVPWDRTGKLSDGNGILLDVTDQEQQGATNPNADAVTTAPTATTAPPADAKPKRGSGRPPEWNGRALIANNLSVYNGGSGIHTFRTKHVDIINNTTYWNGQTVGYQELFPNRSEDVVIMNNIMVPKPGGKITSDNRNTGIKWDYNVYPVAQTVFTGPHDVVADPQFINAQLNPLLGNFKLLAGSPALQSGTRELTQPVDLNHKKRPQGKGPDRGCYDQ